MATADSNQAFRIEGATKCIEALRALERSAENLPGDAFEDARAYYAVQSNDAEALVAKFGPMTPLQEGAFRALAEYIHSNITSGPPNLDKWRPCAGMSPTELNACIAFVNADD